MRPDDEENYEAYGVVAADGREIVPMGRSRIWSFGFEDDEPTPDWVYVEAEDETLSVMGADGQWLVAPGTADVGGYLPATARHPALLATYEGETGLRINGGPVLNHWYQRSWVGLRVWRDRWVRVHQPGAGRGYLYDMQTQQWWGYSTLTGDAAIVFSESYRPEDGRHGRLAYMRPDGTWLWRSDSTFGDDWRITTESEVSP
jgi:hypothetical protein